MPLASSLGELAAHFPRSRTSTDGRKKTQAGGTGCSDHVLSVLPANYETMILILNLEGSVLLLEPLVPEIRGKMFISIVC